MLGAHSRSQHLNQDNLFNDIQIFFLCEISISSTEREIEEKMFPELSIFFIPFELHCHHQFVVRELITTYRPKQFVRTSSLFVFSKTSKDNLIIWDPAIDSSS